ncbi:hypothetical protein GQ44DRAFT_800298 [Phaeosphaeriaceae sp. PMI808]|nr:hypothetical protein GQ44DRAFT_800298 [Phaeosphaeriaceae sp. PMI808]
MLAIVTINSFDASISPILMPAVTDDLNSLFLMGWYGNVHLLAYAIAYFPFTKLYPASYRLQRGKGVGILLLTTIIISGSGDMCCYLISGAVGFPLGRVLNGLGAAGSQWDTMDCYDSFAQSKSFSGNDRKATFQIWVARGFSYPSNSGSDIPHFGAILHIPTWKKLAHSFSTNNSLIRPAKAQPARHFSPTDMLEAFYNLMWGSSFYSFCHFFPTWLRAIRNYSYIQTGVLFLPLATTNIFIYVVLATTSTATRKIKHWKPATCAVSLALIALSAGLSSRFDSSSSLATITGLAILFSIGVGLSVPQSKSRKAGLNTTFEDKIYWSAIGTSLWTFGGSIGIAVAQAVLIRQISNGLPNTNSGIPRSLILHSGATNFRDKFQGKALESATEVLNRAITSTFYVATTAGALPFAITVIMAINVGIRS